MNEMGRPMPRSSDPMPTTSMTNTGNPPRRSGVAIGVRIAALMVLASFISACRPPLPTAEAPIPDPHTFGEVGLAPGQFNYPRALAADDRSLWVIDKSARIQRLDPETGRSLLLFETPEHAVGKPCGLTIGPAPQDPGVRALYVADTHYHRVLVYDIDADPPALIHTFGGFGEAPGQFVYPTDVGLLLDEAGAVQRLYVTEYGGNDRVTAFDNALNPLFEFGRLGVLTDPAHAPAEGEVMFNRPQSIAVRPATTVREAELVITDACNHRIGRFTTEGALIAWMGIASPDRELGALRYPYGLTLLSDGTALVTEFGGSRVQQFHLDTGEPLAIFGEPGRREGQLSTPWALDVLDGRVYILDSDNNRVIAFRSPAPAMAPVETATIEARSQHLADRSASTP